MKIDGIEIGPLLESAKIHLDQESALSPAFKSTIRLLLALVALLLNRLGLNSQNSSKPPSTDQIREKLRKKRKTGKKPGGQTGHNGTTLEKVENPNEIKDIKVDRRTLPRGTSYKSSGWESRQVFDLKIFLHVTEYRAEIVEDGKGKRFTALFPEGVNGPVQYGPCLKAHAVYMSQQQLIPYDRVRDHFQEQIHIPVSAGSIFNFNLEAYEKLTFFEPEVFR